MEDKNRLKMRISRILTFSLSSCTKSKHHSDDVIDTRQNYHLIDLFSPKHPPFHRFSSSLLPSADHSDGRRCPPASPIISPLYAFHSLNPKKKTSDKSRRNKCGFAQEEDHEKTTLFNSEYSIRDRAAATRTRRRRAAEEDTLAVVKRSSDPYSDFRSSMVEMIVEKQIFGAKELEKLLESFLRLNAYHHHKIIFQVFSDIYEAFFT